MKLNLKQVLWIATGAAFLLIGVSKKVWADAATDGKARVEAERR